MGLIYSKNEHFYNDLTENKKWQLRLMLYLLYQLLQLYIEANLPSYVAR